MNDIINNLANWGLNVAFWSSISFLLTISAVWPWWKSAWGSNIMLLELAISLALFPSILSRDFGMHITSDSAALWVEVVALWLVGIIVIWRGVMIVIEQVRGVRRNEHPGTEPIQMVEDDESNPT